MADVFISYAREDEPRARQLAEALTSRGWEVWWDRHITPGELFSKVIQRELEEAPSVVVLWSRGSIASEYVQDEATVAKERGALVPALIDDVQPPLGFRQRQVVNLTAWTGDLGDREYLSLTDAIGRRVSPRVSPGARLDKPPVPIPLERPDTSPHVQDPLARAVAAIRGRPARSMLLAAAVIVVTLAVAWWSLDGPPRHTYRQLDVTVKLGDWMNVRALYGTAAFYRKIHPQVVTGQFFSEEEMWSSPPQRPNVVLLSERFWKEELNSDRSILERSVFLNSYGYRIRGVVSLPRSWNSVDILFPHKASQAPDF